MAGRFGMRSNLQSHVRFQGFWAGGKAFLTLPSLKIILGTPPEWWKVGVLGHVFILLCIPIYGWITWLPSRAKWQCHFRWNTTLFCNRVELVCEQSPNRFVPHTFPDFTFIYVHLATVRSIWPSGLNGFYYWVYCLYVCFNFKSKRSPEMYTLRSLVSHWLDSRTQNYFTVKTSWFEAL